MKFLKTVKTYGMIDVVVPFSSEELFNTFTVVKSTKTGYVFSDTKPASFTEKDLFGNILSHTSYTYVKDVEVSAEIPF